VAKIGGEGNHVAADAIVIVRGMCEDLVSEVKPQVMEPWTKLVFGPGNTLRVNQPAEDSTDRSLMKLAAPDRDKDKRTGACLTEPECQITIEPLFRCCVQGKQPALSKLRISDQQAIVGHVLDPQVERFGDSHPC
jgi:hypothetical protein